MKTTRKQRAIISFIEILIGVMLFFSSGLKLPVLDSMTDAYFRDAITKAGVAYGTCRVINASVSIVKDSSLQVEPAGVGISLAVGQALDPVDDMTERLSDVLVTAITSLGVQKLAYEICVSLAPPILSIFMFVLSVLVWFENPRLAFFHKSTVRLLLLIGIARICFPVSSMTSEFLHKHFFADKISKANKELALGSVELNKLKEFSLPKIDGVLGTIENSALFLKQKSVEFRDALMATVGKTGEIVESLLQLTFLYVGLFLIQVILLPLLSFWLLVKTANTVFHTNTTANKL